MNTPLPFPSIDPEPTLADIPAQAEVGMVNRPRLPVQRSARTSARELVELAQTAPAHQPRARVNWHAVVAVVVIAIFWTLALLAVFQPDCPPHH